VTKNKSPQSEESNSNPQTDQEKNIIEETSIIQPKQNPVHDPRKCKHSTGTKEKMSHKNNPYLRKYSEDPVLVGAGVQNTENKNYEDLIDMCNNNPNSNVYISATREDGSSLFANVGINLEKWPVKRAKVNFKFLHDTGASATLISKDVYDKLPESCQPELKYNAVNIYSANNSKINCYGACKVMLDFNGAQFEQICLVCDLQEDGIIGTDFMYYNHDCDIKVRKMRGSNKVMARWYIDGYEVPLYPWRPRNAKLSLVTPGKVILKSGEEYLLRTKIVGNYNTKDTFMATMPERDGTLYDSLQVANSLIEPRKGEAIIRLINLHEKPITVEKGVTVGKLERVTDCTISKPIPDPVDKSGEPIKNQKKKLHKQMRRTKNIRIRQAEVLNSSSVHNGIDITDIPEYLKDLYKRSSDGLNKSQCHRLKNILIENQACFARDDSDFGHTKIVEHDIDTGDTKPIRSRLRLAPLGLQEEEEKLVTQMLKDGQIEPSSSPWASPVCMVKKKDGSTRFCIDYRRLNDATIKDAYPLPRIQDCLNTLNGGEYFCTLDLKSGYWQVGMTKRARERSAFVCKQGLFQWKVMPFGLCNAPPTFERLMETVLKGLQWKTCLVYLDDIVIFGKNFEECASRLVEVLHCLYKAGLKLKAKKCTLFQREVHFLGHVVSKDGIRTDPAKVAEIANWPRPQEGLKLGRRKIPFVTQVKSFLGVCSYYRKFIPNFAMLAEPLQQYTRDGACLEWTDAADKSFNTLKGILTTSPLLAYPELGKPFIIDADSCDWAMGAVLSQVKEDGKEHPIQYMSKVFSKAERNYCIWRKEFLGVYKAVKDFEPYIIGQECLVRTDNTCVTKMMRMPELSNQNGNLVQYLDSMGVKIIHRKGRDHIVPDALSRKPENEQLKPEILDNHRCPQCTPKQNETAKTRETETQTNEKCTDSFELSRVTTRSEKSTLKNLLKNWSIDSWNENTLRTAQADDPDILNIMELKKQYVKRPEWQKISDKSFGLKTLWNDWDDLKIYDGLLYRDREKCYNLRKKLQLVVPRKLRNVAFKEVHGTPFGGHTGFRKTLAKIRERFYWPRMSTDCKIWIQQCDYCAQNKPTVRYLHSHLQVYTVGEPLERTATDVAGPLPTTKQGNKYIVVVGDYFTKWIEAIPIPDQQAETVARAILQHFVLKFGVPFSLHSDQGKNYESVLWRELCSLMGIKKTRTSAYRPQSDGFIERFNRTLWSMLRSSLQEKGKGDWDELVPILSMAYRASVNETTGFTPNMLMLGRELNMPLDLVIPQGKEETIKYPEYIEKLKEHMETVYTEVRKNTKWAVERQRKYYDGPATVKNIKVGDWVWYNIPTIDNKLASKKLNRKKRGPYLVIKHRGNVKFVIALGRDQVKSVHVDQLSLYLGTKRPKWGKAYTEDIEKNKEKVTQEKGCGTQD